MFDVGFTEMLMIGVVALVVIGPERLPDVARTVGGWVGKAQKFIRGVKSDLASELDSGDLKKIIGDQREQIDELRGLVNHTAKEVRKSTGLFVDSARKQLSEMEESADKTGQSVQDSTVREESAGSVGKSGAPSLAPDESTDSSDESVVSWRSSAVKSSEGESGGQADPDQTGVSR